MNDESALVSSKPETEFSFPQPRQLRELGFLALGATFPPSLLREKLPQRLSPCEGWTGGFLVGLAREGHQIAPFGVGQVWFDVQGHDGSEGPCRFLAQHSNTEADPEVSATLSEAGQTSAGQLGRGEEALFRISLRPRQNWISAAGVDHSMAPGQRGLTRMTVTPWAAEWCDAEPGQFEALSPDWAPFKPTRLTWAAVGRRGAMTLGLSRPLMGRPASAVTGGQDAPKA